MRPQQIQLGYGALAIMVAYLLVMLALGWLGRMRRREQSLRDFYLGGSSFGFAVLFLTLFATQYSGNTLLGFAGRSYRQGLTYIVSITFMIFVIVTYMVYAPRLFRLSRKFGYITPADYIFHRFGSHALRIMSALLLCWGLGNYILEQLVAIGHFVEGITGGRIDFMTGVIVLAVVMLIYESLGGMRSVAWTDAVQGLLLFAGCGTILYIILASEGGLESTAEVVRRIDPEKLQTPDAEGIRNWVSAVVMIGVGIAIYPHAIQRLFAARSLTSLRRSLALMAFMPLVTTFLAFLIGYIGLGMFPDLKEGQIDKITIYVLAGFAKKHVLVYWLVVVVLAAVVAAIMSTADSALLSIGSMVTKDIYQPYIRPDASPAHLLNVGKLTGWALMIFLIAMAYISVRTESSIWLLIKLKLEFMVQLAPAVVLGVHWRRLAAGATLAGVAMGTAITLVIWVGVMLGWEGFTTRTPMGIHAGVWGLMANVGVCLAGTLMRPRRRIVD